MLNILFILYFHGRREQTWVLMCTVYLLRISIHFVQLNLVNDSNKRGSRGRSLKKFISWHWYRVVDLFYV